ncbi:MAG TPA: hypothetical protein VIM34_16985 [Burkholderiaceae bacterium]
MKLLYALALVCVCAPCWAQTAPAAPARVETQVVSRSEPAVQHIVIEDKGSKIDELRVRGQTRHVIVTPKVGLTRSYEITVSRTGRIPVEGAAGIDGTVGQRVWNVLAF